MVPIQAPPIQVPAVTAFGEAVGIGVDVADVAEFEALPFDQHTAFYRRCFSPDEIAYCRAQPSSAQHFAARFAAKEATVKAFSNLVQLAYWQVEVIRGNGGAPSLRLWREDLSGPASELKQYRSLVSLSHTNSLATAFVVVYDRRSQTDAR